MGTISIGFGGGGSLFSNDCDFLNGCDGHNGDDGLRALKMLPQFQLRFRAFWVHATRLHF